MAYDMPIAEPDVSQIAIGQHHQAVIDTVDKEDESILQASDAVKQTPKPPFVTTPAHKAAKTRSLKTLETFSAEQAYALSPSNCFVKLRVSTERLRQAQIPEIKTWWEEKIIRDAKIKDNDEPKQSDGIAVDASQQVHPGLNSDDTQNEVAESNRNDHAIEKVDTNMTAKQLGPVTANHCQQSKGEPRLYAGTELGSVSNELTFRQETYLVPHNTFEQTRPAFAYTETVPQRREISDSSHLNTSYLTARPHDLTGCPPALHGASRPEENGGYQNNPTHDSSQIVREPPSERQTILETYPDPDVHNSRSYTSDVQPKRTRSSYKQLKSEDEFATIHQEDPSEPESVFAMAPVRDPNNVDTALKDAIQKLYEVQSQVHGFVPETQPLLIDKMTEVAHSLAHLQTLTSTTQSPNNPIHKNRIAPEVIDYVDDSRNPDIYNREFVELVQRGNAVMNGKQQAFRDFSEIFARTLKERMPELADGVDKIMENANMPLTKSNAESGGSKQGNGSHEVGAKSVGRSENSLGTNGNKAT